MSERVILCDGRVDLRLGDWREVLADVMECDAVITDPPFSRRTHEGQRHGRKDPRYCDPQIHPLLSSRGLSYDFIDEDGVNEIVDRWAPITRKWFGALTSHDLVRFYEAGMKRHGRTEFIPVPCVQEFRNVRLAGDGAASWTDYLTTARPPSLKWRALHGAYYGPSFDDGENALDRSKRPTAGGKPLWLMRKIIRDYTSANDLVIDPYGGRFTTAVACALEGRRCITCERDTTTYAAGARWVKQKLNRVDAAARQMSALSNEELRTEAKRLRRAKVQSLFSGGDDATRD